MLPSRCHSSPYSRSTPQVLRKDEADQLIDPAQAPKDETNIATFLRSKHSTLRHREGLLNGQRVEYFKGIMKSTGLRWPVERCA